MKHTHTHSTHSTHPALVKRLRRAQGHLASVIEMIEQDRECLDIAQQLQAVEKAITHAKRALVQDHIDHCLEHALGARNVGRSTSAAIDEFKQITRYL
jgi:uncharacterized protein